MRKKLTDEEKKERRKKHDRLYREKNKEKIKKYRQENKERDKEKMRNYYYNNKDKYNENRKKNRENNPLFKLSTNIRSLIIASIKRDGYKKDSRTYEILGCSYEYFKEYIESFFIEDRAWMNWDNYGNPVDGIVEPNKTWDIDHIIPLSSFNTEQELLELNHYTNLQPLCSYYNRFVKRNKSN